MIPTDLAALVSRLHGLSSDCALRQKWADSATAHKASGAIRQFYAALAVVKRTLP